MENQKRLGILAAILVLVFLGLLYWLISSTQPTIPLPKAPAFVWGMYAVGGPDEIEALEAKLGRKADIAATFMGFWEEFPEEFVARVASASTTPLIFSETGEGTTLVSVVDGIYDQELKAFAEAAKRSGVPIILVPFNEANLNEFPWGFGFSRENTAESFKAAWRHVYNIIHPVAPNVKFGIAYNHVSIPDDPDNTFMALYPGAQYVDYVGIDGFNWQEEGSWESFTEVMGSTTEELIPFNKPIYIFSTGTGDDEGGDPSLKAAWITEMFQWLKTRPHVEGVIWFHEDKTEWGEKDWRIDSTPESLSAFKEGLNF